MPQFKTLVQAQLHDMGTEIRNARGWFRGKVAEMTGKTPKSMMSNVENHRGLAEIGSMYAYFYNAKHKKTLPYYDRFPLTIVIEKYADGFLGLNLHYLPPRYRLILMDKLMDLTTQKELTKTTRLKLTYGVLRAATKYKEVKPCIKKYLYGHIETKFLFISPTEWEKAIFLPVERFVGKGKSAIWEDSIGKM